MARPLCLLVAALIALGTIGISAAHPASAAGTNVANCSFATLQSDLQAGGDWYYTAGQCPSPIIFTTTISIGSNASLTAQGDDVTLDGGHTSTVSGVELFNVNAGTTFGLTGLTLAHGSSSSYGGAIYNSGTLTVTNSTLSGNSVLLDGLIYNNAGTLTITSSTLSGNSARDGGAIVNVGSGTLTITSSTLSGNSATLAGGALANDSGTATITSSTLSGNSATSSEGGAIFNYAGSTLTITSSTLSGNSSYTSGAIFNSGTLTVTNSALSGDSATSDGGAIENSGRLTIASSTLSGNHDSNSGGAIFNWYIATAATITGSTLSGNSARVGGAIEAPGAVTIGGSIVANSTGGNCDGSITDTGYNLEWSGAGHTDTCAFGGSGKHDITGIDPQLGALQDNGGPTQTMALLAGSPAIDQIPTSSGLCPTTDQRGVARPDNGGASCDIGAYELDETSVTPTPPTTSIGLSPSQPNGLNNWYTGPVTVSVTASDPDDAASTLTTRCVLDPASVPASFSALPSGSCAYAASGGAGVSTDGSHTLYAASEDPAGNVEATVHSSTFQIDGTAPTVACTAPAPSFVYGQSGATVSATVSDGTSGPAQSPVSAVATTSSIGSPSVSLTGADKAGNTATISCPYTVTKAATTATVSSSANPSVTGQSITLTATVAVTAPGAGTPTGTVEFKDGSSDISGCGSVSLNSSGTATCPRTYSSTGSRTITAVYSGDADFGGVSSAGFTQNVDTNLSGFPTLPNGAYNLASVNLAGAYLVGANLAGADMTSANFKGANLSGASLTRANLSSANFKGANFSTADLTNANLTKTNLKGAQNMSTATLTGVTWSETTCPDNTSSTNDGGTCAGHL